MKKKSTTTNAAPSKQGRLDGQHFLVTGAAQGIGLAIAEEFLSQGAHVFLVDKDKAKLQTELKRLQSQFANAANGLALDVAPKTVTSKAAASAMQAAVKAFGHLDGLVNNAGITHGASFLDLKEADFDRVLSINLKSYVFFGQAFAKQCIASKRAGVIINMSSVNAVLAIPDQVPYVVSKGAVNQLTKVMAMGLADYGIRVNAIGPGTIATELARKAVMASDAGRRRVLSRTPLKRMGETSEVAKVALFLASSDSSYLTGQTIYPDGGRLALNYTVSVE